MTDARPGPGTVVTLSLVAHTNVGKTTLARTLLRRDVGEVLDQAHVTVVTEPHDVLAADGARLVLEDTPGFGDSARLLKRLRAQGNPLGWFAHQVWDRFRDRPLFCAQQAVASVRDRADVVLYLVNATERPEDAGYVAPEMEILAWAERPVLLLLNQTGATPVPSVPATWRAWAQAHPHVKDVLSLDAFTRCWVEERTLYERAAALVPPEKQPAMKALLAAWDREARSALTTSADAVAAYLVRAAADRVALPEKAGKADRTAAMEALTTRTSASTRDLVATLLGAHGLDAADAARSAAVIEERLEDFAVKGLKGPDGKKSALWGGILSGALSGLAADLAAGGLSFGGGAVIGAIVGALGGASLPKVYALAGRAGPPSIGWSDDGLGRFARGAVARYVAVAHFGRGRGAWKDLALPATLEAAVGETFARHERAVLGALSSARSAADAEATARAKVAAAQATNAWLRDLLRHLYPACGAWLR